MAKERMSVTLLEALLVEVDVKDLLNNISFDETNLIEAAMQQSALLKEALRLRVQYTLKRSRLEAKLEVLRGELGQKYRNIRGSSGKREHTEGAVKNFVETRPSVMALRKKIDTMFALEDMAKSIVDVYRSRKDMIRVVVDAGKISAQMQELAAIKGSAKLRKALATLRNRWQSGGNEDI